MPNFRWICPKNMEKWQFFGALCALKILILLSFAQKSLSYYTPPLGHSEEYSPMVMKSIEIFNLVIADRFGEYHENEVRGFYSRVLQHEIDHLCGSLFVNKIVHSSTDSSDIGHLLLS